MRLIAPAAALALFCFMPVEALADPLPPAQTPPKSQPLKPGPLTSGKSAGLHAAQLPQTGFALVGAGAIIAIVVVAASSSGGGGNGGQVNQQSVPVTTTTP